MASFDDIFGRKGGEGSKFLKFTEDKETFLLQQTGEPEPRDQMKKDEDGKDRAVWLVKLASATKYKPMLAGEFDPDSEEVENAFKPDPQYVFPVRIIGHKNAKGETLADFDDSEVKWDTSGGDTFDKLKDALMDADAGPEIGTVYAVKRLTSKEKPYKWSVKVVKTADEAAGEKA